ncbi:MAG: hypothetical protein RRZ42_04745 [Oscillospiraceae bacterium]
MELLTKPKNTLRSGTRVFIVVLVNIGILILCSCVFAPRPENNDDFIVHSVLGGAFGTPSEYIGIVNVILARIIVLLQGLAPSLNWFSILLYGALCLSFICVASVVWLERPDAVGMFLSLSFSVFISVPMYLSMQGTKFAIFIAAAGLLTLLYGVKDRPKPAAVALGAFLSVFAASVRLMSFAAGAATVALPVLFAMLSAGKKLRAGEWLKSNRGIIIYFASIFLLVLSLNAAHGFIYSQNQSAEAFTKYLSSQQRVLDYELADYESRYDSYTQLDLSENDLEMIRLWSSADSEYFSAERLKEIAEAGKPESMDIGGKFMQGLTLFTFTKSTAWFAGAVLLLSLFLADNRTRLRCSLIIASYFALLLMLAAAGRVTRWVCMGLLASVCASVTVCLACGHIVARKKKAIVFTASLLACCLGFTAFTLPKNVQKPEPDELIAIYDDFNAHGDTLYMADMSSMPQLFERISVFRAAPRGIYSNIYVLGGWDTATPAKNSVLERFGINGSCYGALYTRDDVMLIDTVNFDSKAKFVREHISKTACWTLYDIIDGLYVYALTDTLTYRLTDNIKIIDYSQAPNEYNGAFRTFNLVVSADCDAECCFVEFDAKGGPPMTYRARVIKREGSTLFMTFSVPALDVPDLSGRTMRAIIKTSNGTMLAGLTASEQ